MKKTVWDYFYVGIQLILFALYLIPVIKLDFSTGVFFKIMSVSVITSALVLGLISVSQLNRNLSPFPTPLSGNKLIETGAYKYIRHPIYTSILFFFAGIGVYSGSGYKLIITATLFVLFYFKSKYEEQKLCAVFSDYPNYINRTGRFLPRLFL